MKKLNKALTGVTAIVMAFSVSAMAACTNGDDDGKRGEGAKAVAVKVLDAYNQQTVKGVSFTSLTENVMTVSTYESDAKGEKLPDAEESTYRTKNTVSESGKTNYDLANLTGDFFTDTKVEALKADGSVDVTQKAGRYYNYTFVRGGNLFTYGTEEATVDFSKVAINYEGSIADALPEGVTLEDALGALEETGLSSITSLPVSLILNLANDFGGVTETSGKVTVDFNKVTYNAYNSVIEVIDGLDENTTVGDLIGAKPVKSLVGALTYGIDAKTVYDSVIAQFGGNGADAAVNEMIKSIPAPTEKQSVYDYLVSLLNSKDFAGFVLSMVTGQPMGSLAAPFAEYKLADVMAIVSQIGGSGNVTSPAAEAEGGAGMTPLTMAQIKAMAKEAIAEYVSVTEDTVTVEAGVTVSVSDLKIDFCVNDNYEIRAIDVTGKQSVNSLEVMGDEYDGEASYFAGRSVTEGEISCLVNFSANDLGYENIENSNAYVRVNELGEGVYYADAVYCCDYLLRITANAEGEVTLLELTEDYGGEAVGTYDAQAKSVTVGETVVTLREVSEGEAYIYVNGTSYGADIKQYKKVSDIIKKA